MHKRLAEKYIFSDEYTDKMRFVAGPRQSGKTTLAQNVLKRHGLEKLYYNWDRREIRNKYYNNAYFYNDDLLSFPAKTPKWICFDEIHKMPKWKNILKDVYDTDKDKTRFIITGSARLDLFRKSGDSLTGRYFLFHLFPLSLKEVSGGSQALPPEKALAFIDFCLAKPSYHQEKLDSLLQFSGFPEPQKEGKERFLRMWQNNYVDTILKEDLRDLSRVKDIEQIGKLAAILPSKIGSPLSINSLVNDMEVSYPAIRNYLRLLVLTYFVFALPPFNKKIARAIKKEKKYYCFDWSRISDQSIRFENYLAFELFNLTSFWKDHGFGDFSLSFLRTRNGEETDFLITKDSQPWLLIEAKLNEEDISGHHIKQAEALGGVPFIQLVYKKGVAKKKGKNLFVVSASRFLA